MAYRQSWREEGQKGGGFLVGGRISIDEVTDLIKATHDIGDRISCSASQSIGSGLIGP